MAGAIVLALIAATPPAEAGFKLNFGNSGSFSGADSNRSHKKPNPQKGDNLPHPDCWSIEYTKYNLSSEYAKVKVQDTNTSYVYKTSGVDRKTGKVFRELFDACAVASIGTF